MRVFLLLPEPSSPPRSPPPSQTTLILCVGRVRVRARRPTSTHQGYDFSDFFDTNTMQYGPKGGPASAEAKKGKKGHVDGFGLFEKGRSHRMPGFDPPTVIKDMLSERSEKRQQQLKEKKEKKHA